MVRPRRRGGDRRSLPRPDHDGPLEFSHFPVISHSTSVFTALKSRCFCFVPRALSHTYFHRVHSFDPWPFHIRNHSSEASKTLSDESSGEQLYSRTRIVTKPPTLLLSLTSLSLEFSGSLHETQVEVWSLPLARNIHGAHSWDQVSCVSG